MQNELIELAKKCKSADEILSLAKEKGMEMTEAEATNCFAMLNKQNGEMADSELASVSAGACGKLYYPSEDGGYLKVSGWNSCDLHVEASDYPSLTFSGTCERCIYYYKPSAGEMKSGATIGFCRRRTEDNDPLA